MSDDGVQFTVTDGKRSSSAAARDVLCEAVRAVDPDLAADIEAERSWRKAYPDYLRRLTAVSAGSASAGQAMARAGLDALHHRLEFVREGAGTPLLTAVATTSSAAVRTETVVGSAARAT
jgi:hypothetical protein